MEDMESHKGSDRKQTLPRPLPSRWALISVRVNSFGWNERNSCPNFPHRSFWEDVFPGTPPLSTDRGAHDTMIGLWGLRCWSGEKHDLDDTHLGENTHSRCPLGGHKNVPKSETHDTLEIRNVATGSFHQEMPASNYLTCFFVSMLFFLWFVVWSILAHIWSPFKLN